MGSLQARLGSQGDAQAMQAVRTARGNSFCVDCDAPSKKCCTGGAHPGGEGLQTPPLSAQKSLLCVSVLSAPAVDLLLGVGLQTTLPVTPHWPVTPRWPVTPCWPVTTHWPA